MGDPGMKQRGKEWCGRFERKKASCKKQTSGGVGRTKRSGKYAHLHAGGAQFCTANGLLYFP